MSAGDEGGLPDWRTPAWYRANVAALALGVSATLLQWLIVGVNALATIAVLAALLCGYIGGVMVEQTLD